jgi:hypothetical protein
MYVYSRTQKMVKNTLLCLTVYVYNLFRIQFKWLFLETDNRFVRALGLF